MPLYLTILLIAMSPILELRGAIPFGILNKAPLYLVFLLSVIGNIIPVIILLKILPKFFPSLLWKYTYHRHKKKFLRFRDIALIILIAIPLPFTGAWTGALASVVFNVPFKRALFLITCGVIIAGIIVSMLTLGILSF